VEDKGIRREGGENSGGGGGVEDDEGIKCCTHVDS